MTFSRKRYPFRAEFTNLNQVALCSRKERTYRLAELLLQTTICSIALLVVVNGSAANMINPAYSLEGILKYNQTGPRPGSGISQQWDFTLLGDKDGRWKMTLHTKSPMPRLPVESTQHVAYDGTNIYSVTYSPQLVATPVDSPPKLIPATQKTGAAILSPGPYPIDYGGAVGVLWFAFFGGQYLDSGTNKAFFPNLILARPRDDPMAWTCQLAYRLTTNSLPHIVEEASFYFDPERFHADSTKYPEMDEPVSQETYNRLNDVFKRYKPLTGASLLRSKYALEQTIKIGDYLLPSQFHIDLFAVDSLDASFVVECEVTHVQQSISAVDILPPLDGVVNVHDQRFRLKESLAWRGDIHYILGSDGWIIDTNDPRIKAALARSPMLPILNKTNLIVRGGEPKTMLFRILLGIMIILPIIVLTVRHLGGKASKSAQS